MNEQVRLLLEETQTRNAILQQDLMNITSKIREDDCKEYIEKLFDIKKVLTPLEIDIRKMELQLKTLTLTLPDSEEYLEKYDTIKAREKQVKIETNEIKENILNLKRERNKLRDKAEYLKYSIENMILGDVE